VLFFVRIQQRQADLLKDFVSLQKSPGLGWEAASAGSKPADAADHA